ncbi:MAG: surface-adhesin E family protein [Sulfuricella sp.]
MANGQSRMKRALLLLLTCLAAAPSVTIAAEWVKIHTAADQSLYFYDRSKLFLNDDEITYWKKVVFKTPQPFKDNLIASGLYRERIHCAEHTLKLISYLLYTPAGELFEYAPTKEGDSAPIIPDSLGDVFEKALCPLVRQKQEEDRLRSEAKAKAEAAEKAAAEEKAKIKAETEAAAASSQQPATPPPGASVPQH